MIQVIDMEKEKILIEIAMICNTHGCRSVDPSQFREDIYKLIEKYAAGDVNIISYSPPLESYANRTRNRPKKRRGI